MHSTNSVGVPSTMSSGPSITRSTSPNTSQPLSVIPRVYLLLENPTKTNNLGPILRCANAFGITTVVAVGYAKCSVYGSHGASKNVQIIAYPTIEQAIAFLRSTECSCQSLVGLVGSVPDGFDTSGRTVHEDEENEKGIPLARVLRNNSEGTKELAIRSFPVYVHPFSTGNVCIVLSKERLGLPLTLARHCDALVHVPHVAIQMGGDSNSRTPPLLDIQTCLSITLHHFTNWAGYDEQTFQGHKFEIIRSVQDASGPDHFSLTQERAKSKRALQQAAEEAVNEGNLVSMFEVEDAQGDY